MVSVDSIPLFSSLNPITIANAAAMVTNEREYCFCIHELLIGAPIYKKYT
jgi:hypothetical protein